MEDFFEDLDKYLESLYCIECGQDENLKYDRTVSNGEIWICPNCGHTIIVNHRPNEDNY